MKLNLEVAEAFVDEIFRDIPEYEADKEIGRRFEADEILLEVFTRFADCAEHRGFDGHSFFCGMTIAWLLAERQAEVNTLNEGETED
jgi:hypothetical protein